MRLGVLVAASALVWLSWDPVRAQAPDAEPSAQAHALRQVIAMMEAEAAELKPRLETARGQLADLTRQIDEVTARLETGRADLIRLQTDQDRIKAAIAERRAERDRQTTAIQAAQAELSDLTDQIDDARAQAEAGQAAFQTAQADLTGLTDRIGTARAELADLTARQEAAQASLARSQDLAAQIADQERRVGELTESVRQLTAELTVLTRVRDAALSGPEPEAQAESEPGAAIAAATAAPDPRPPGPRRDPALVDAALAQAPALPAAAQRARLRDLLIGGHCATDALRQVQDPINRQTLLVLVGRLGGC